MSIKFTPAKKEFGFDPIATPEMIYQGYDDTCAIRSQEIILRDFGINVSQEQLIQTAADNGWYSPGGGTSPDDVGNLLEHYGVPVTRCENANVFNLANELAQGHKVIVGVDAKELWGQTGIVHNILEFFGVETPNHALIVSGIDTSDPNHVTVTVTDPGTGDVAKVYSWEEFSDAWKDSNCMMVSTSLPAPATLPEMQNFDYALGHLPTIGGLDYGKFIETYSPFMGMSADFPEFQNAFESFTNEWEHCEDWTMNDCLPSSNEIPFAETGENEWEISHHDYDVHQDMSEDFDISTSDDIFGVHDSGDCTFDGDHDIYFS